MSNAFIVMRRTLTLIFLHHSADQLLLDGISEYASVPLAFAQDICMFHIDGIEYAAAVHSSNMLDLRNSTRISIYRMDANRYTVQVYAMGLPHIVSMDCLSFGSSAGYVAVAVDISSNNGNQNSLGMVLKIEQSLDSSSSIVTSIHQNTMLHQNFVRLW